MEFICDSLACKALLTWDETERGAGFRNAEGPEKYFAQALRDWQSGSVIQAMFYRFLPMPLAFWLVSMPAAGSASSAAEIGAQLPGGNSDAFRQRMMAWTASTQSIVQPAAPAQTSGRAAPITQLPRLSSGFGDRTDPLLGTHRMHAGIDIPGPAGTLVLASASGIVRFAGAAGSYGKMVEIDHGGGLRTRYAHLSRILVRPGDTIARQQTIALMGSTGRSTGSHLHFEVRTNGRAANPLAYFGYHAPVPAPSIAWQPQSLAQSQPYLSQFARTRTENRPLPGGGS